MPPDIDIHELEDDAVEEVDLNIVPEHWVLCLIRYPEKAMPNMEKLNLFLGPHGYKPDRTDNCVVVWNDPKTNVQGLEDVLRQIRDALPGVQIDFPQGKNR